MRYMLIGYARVSKTDGSQSLDLRRDASFARVSAAVGMRRQDYFRQGVRGVAAAALDALAPPDGVVADVA